MNMDSTLTQTSLTEQVSFGAPTETCVASDLSPRHPIVAICPKIEQHYDLEMNNEYVFFTPIYDAPHYTKYITAKIDTRYQIKQNLAPEFMRLQGALDDVLDAVKQSSSDIFGETAAFTFDATAHLANISIDTVQQFLGELKPMTLTFMLTSYVAAKTTGEKYAIMNCMYEIFSDFWTQELFSFKDLLITCGVWIIERILKQCWKSVRDNLGLQHDYMQTESIDIDENGMFAKLLGLFNINKTELSTHSSFLGTIVLILLLILSGGKISSFAQLSFDKMFKRLNKASTTIKSIYNLQEFLPKVWENTLGELGSLLGFTYVNEDDDVKKFAEEIISFKTKVNDLREVVVHEPWKLTNNPELMKEIEIQYGKLDQEYIKFMKIKKNMSAAKIVFDELKEMIKKLRDYAEKVKHASASKPEPFVLMLGGKPGIGKSRMVDKFIKDFAARTGVTPTSYLRNSGEKYWSNYVGQSFVVFDDFGAIKVDSDHADMLLVKNPNKTILPMADIAEKGTQFSSIGLICCTNDTAVSSSAVVKCTEALIRRFEIKISVVDPNYQDFVDAYNSSPGDYQKSTGKEPLIADEDGNLVPYYDVDNFTHLQFFQEAHFQASEQIPKELQYKDIVDLAINYYKYYMTTFERTFGQPPIDNFKTTTDQAERVILQTTTETVKFVKEKEVEEEPLVGATAADDTTDTESIVTTSSSSSYEAGLTSQEISLAKRVKRKRGDYAQLQIDEIMLKVKQKAEEEATQSTFKSMVKEFKGKANAPFSPELVTYQRNWIKEYRKSHPEARKFESMQAFNAAHEQSVLQSLDQPFTSTHRSKCPIFLLSGAPGTGKSTTSGVIQNRIPGSRFIHGETLHNAVFERGILFVEDASITPQDFAVFERLVCRVYDNNHAVKGIVASVNQQIMDRYFETYEQRERFYRRCNVVDFQFGIREKKVFTKDLYYDAGCLEAGVPYDDAVIIKAPNLQEGRVAWTQVCEWITDTLQTIETVEIPIATAVPYISLEQVDPQFIVEFSTSLEEAFPLYMQNPGNMVLDIATRKVKLVKGGVLEGTKIAKAFTFKSKNETIRWPGSLDQFIIIVNNSSTISPESFTTLLKGTTESVLITTMKRDPRRLMMFKIDPDVKVNSTKTAVAVGDDITALNEESRQVYQDVNFIIETADQIDEHVQVIEETTMQEVNIKTIFKKFPKIEKITGIFFFMIKLYVAGRSISNLWSAAKTRYQEGKSLNQFKVEAKGMKQLSRKLNSFKVSQSIYDDFKDVLRTKCKTANKLKVKDAVDFYMFYYGLSEDDVSIDEFADFYSKVHPTNYERINEGNYYTESREEKVVVNKPVPVVMANPYLLESVVFDGKDPKKALEDFGKVKKKTINLPTIKEESLPQNLTEMDLEACLDPSIREMVNLTYDHSVDIHNADHDKVMCHGLMIQGRVGVTVGHVFKQDTLLYATTYKGVQPIRMPIEVLKVFNKIDIMIFKLPKQMPSYKSIMHHLPSIKDKKVNSFVDNRAAILNIPDLSQNTKLVLNARVIGFEEVHTQVGLLDGVSYNSPITYLGSPGLKTPINTESGDCGSAVIVNDSTVLTKIIAIHNAANSTKAHGSFVFRELFRDCMNLEALMPEMKPQINPYHELELREMTREALLNMPIVGTGNLAVHRPVKSALWTSPLALPESSSYQPSILDPYDNRNNSGQDPYYSSVAKWANPQPTMDEGLLDRCVDDIGYWYAMTIKARQHQTKVLTKTEAINSGKDINVMPINRASSAGYPWSRFGKKSTFLVNKGSPQTAYYGIDYTKKCGQLLNASVDFIIQTCKNPASYVPIPFSGWLKDEPLKMKKIYTVNTRSFAGAPFDYTIAYRMYFAPIYGAIHEVRDVMPIQVGINPTSLEWDFMTRRLLSTSNTGFDLDFQGFDSTVPSIVQKKIVNIHNKIAQINDPNWKPEDDIIRRGLHQALVKPLLVCPSDNTTYILQAPGGQPSGHPGTADDNSLIHLVYLYYSYLTLMIARGQHHLANMLHFKEKVQAIIYGDDGVYMICPSIQEHFNFGTVATVLNGLGIKCTPAAKGAVIQNIISIFECEFLKRDFVQLGKHYYGALKKLSFAKMLGYCLGPLHHWHRDQTRTYAGRPNDLKATADACLSEAIMHGRKFFDEMSMHLMKTLCEVDIEYFPPRYEDVVSAVGLPLPL